MWYRKIFLVLEGVQDGVILSGRVWFDETFFPVIKGKIVLHKNGKKLRGISRNQICVAAAIDQHGNKAMIVEWVCKPSARSTLLAMGKHIAPGSTLVHDGDNSHKVLIETLGLKSEVHPTKETKGLEDRGNPMDPINDLHSLMKRFMTNHGGYDRAYLQDWMNLAWFILSGPDTVVEKFKDFVKRAISVHKTLRYDMTLSKSRNKHE